MTQNNVMENILSIELGQMVIDGTEPSNCIMIVTKRNRYCFRLSETFPTDKQIGIFQQFIADVNTPIEKAQPIEQPKTEEKHDGAKLLDEPPAPPTDVEITVKPAATQD